MRNGFFVFAEFQSSHLRKPLVVNIILYQGQLSAST
jgi:hypothetical protein